ncbi:MAG: membrane protein insertion efficiency factor YidD [bacterium]|nr:membrane protein insertion efficiency factor YidD [bacterium]
MKKLALVSIRFYQKYLSLDQGLPHRLLPGLKVCRHTPTCSDYSYQAIEKYGVVKGGGLSLWRILRCNPFNKGGYDPVPG